MPQASLRVIPQAAAGNMALRYDAPPDLPLQTHGFLQRQPAQREDHTLLARLNQKLRLRHGEDFTLQCYTGSNLHNMPRSTLLSLAQCYADVFNESWGENWTLESALKEVEACINCSSEFLPIMTLLFKEERVIGFCWGFLMDSQAVTESNAPFSASKLKRHESVEIARYWMDKVGNKSQLIALRELGVIKEYRQDKAPYMTIPIFEKAASLDHNVAFLRTRLSSKVFKWGLGVGFVPLQLFMEDELLLMKGNIRYALSILHDSIDDLKKRKAQVNIVSNIKRYMCD
jgi:hypothetical protein